MTSTTCARRIVETAGRHLTQDIDTFRTVVGVDGAIPGTDKAWSWNLDFNFGRSTANRHNRRRVRHQPPSQRARHLQRLRRDFKSPLGTSGLTVGVLNALHKDPPYLFSGASPTPSDGATYDCLGRFFSARLSQRF